MARDPTERSHAIARVTRRLRPSRVASTLEWLRQHVQRVPPVDLPPETSAEEAATLQLFYWLERVDPHALARLGGLWATLSDGAFEVLLRDVGPSDRAQVVHGTLGRYDSHRRGSLVVVRRRYPDDRVQVSVRYQSDARTARDWLGRQAKRVRQQIPPALAGLPDHASEPDLPDWLSDAVARPPARGFPVFVDARRAPVLVRRDTDVALSTGAVSGLLKELHVTGTRAIRQDPSLHGPVPGHVRDLLTVASGEALAAWLLELWGDDGGYAAQRWCTLPLLIWPSAENTRHLGRVIDELRSRLNSAGVRFGVRLLESIGDDAALALLARFAQHGSYAQSRDANAAIVEAARSRGLERTAIDELAPLGMDDFDVDDHGTITMPFAEGVAAEIDVTDLDRLRPRWRVGARLLKRAPNGLKGANPDATEQLERLLRRLHRDVRREVTRLEQDFIELDGRAWSSFAVYFHHRLLRLYVRGLVWQIPVDGRWEEAIAKEDGSAVFHDLTGRRIAVDDQTAVRLLHPADLPADALEVWRDRLLERGLAQPFAQLDRRTWRGDASIWLDFAGVWHDHLEHGIGRHFVRFHDGGLVSLKVAAGYSLVGRWRPSPARHWAVRALRNGSQPGGALVTGEPGPPDAMPDDFVDPYAVWVDRLHFVRDGAPVPGDEVPPRLFSEVNLAIRRWDVGRSPSRRRP